MYLFLEKTLGKIWFDNVERLRYMYATGRDIFIQTLFFD